MCIYLCGLNQHEERALTKLKCELQPIAVTHTQLRKLVPKHILLFNKLFNAH